MALQLPIHLLAELVRQSENLVWGAALPFQQALRSRSKESISARQVRSSRLGPMFEAMRAVPPRPEAGVVSERENVCAKIQRQLDELNERMRAGYSAREAARLWQRWRDTKERLRTARC